MYNYKALQKWREKCGLIQEDIATAVGLSCKDNISRFEHGQTSITAEKIGIIIDLFSTHLSASELSEFITELFDIKVRVASQPQTNIDYPKWIKDKDKIINGLEKELKNCTGIIDYARENCEKKTCPIMKLIA